MEKKPGVGPQPASAAAMAQETAPHHCFALATGTGLFPALVAGFENSSDRIYGAVLI
jgi:hypothetical protein